MKSDNPWDRLVEAARRAPEAPPAAPPDGWTEAVARRSMAGAALGKPTVLALGLAWISSTNGLLFLMALLIGGGGLWTTHLVEARRPEVRFERWAGETLVQVRTWLPLECEEAGTIGILLRRRMEEVRSGGTGPVNVALLLRATEDEIAGLLTPDQRSQFEARQRELHRRWFPTDETR